MSVLLTHRHFSGWFPFLINKHSDIDTTNGASCFTGLSLPELVRLWWLSKTYDYAIAINYNFGVTGETTLVGTLAGSGTIQASADGIVASEVPQVRLCNLSGQLWPCNVGARAYGTPKPLTPPLIITDSGTETDWNPYTGIPSTTTYAGDPTNPGDWFDFRFAYPYPLTLLGSVPNPVIPLASGGPGSPLPRVIAFDDSTGLYYSSIFISFAVTNEIDGSETVVSAHQSTPSDPASPITLTLTVDGHALTIPFYTIFNTTLGALLSGSVSFNFNTFYS